MLDQPLILSRSVFREETTADLSKRLRILWPRNITGIINEKIKRGLQRIRKIIYVHEEQEWVQDTPFGTLKPQQGEEMKESHREPHADYASGGSWQTMRGGRFGCC